MPVAAPLPPKLKARIRSFLESTQSIVTIRLARGHAVSAGHAYLRAATYYRAALHRHLHPYSDEVAELTRRDRTRVGCRNNDLTRHMIETGLFDVGTSGEKEHKRDGVNWATTQRLATP